MFRPLILLALCASFCLSVETSTTISVDAVNHAPATISLTSTEQLIVLTKDANSQPRVVTMVCDQAWGINDTAASTFASKIPVAANQSWTIKVNGPSETYAIQASSTTGTFHLYTLAASP